MSNTSVNNKRIAKNTFYLYVRMLFVLVVSLYSTRLVLNSLGSIDYGINNVVCGFVAMFAFFNNSLSNGIQRFYNFVGNKEGYIGYNKVFNSSIFIQIILALVIVLFLETAGLWYLKNEMIIPENRLETAIIIFHLSVASFALVVVQIPYSAAIIAFERMNFFAIVSISDAIMKLLSAISLSYISADKLMIYGICSFCIAIFNFFMYYIYVNKHIEILKLDLKYDNTLLKDILSFSGWNIFGTFAYMIKNQGLNILINLFFGPSVNAAKAISTQVENAIHGFSTNIVMAVRPQLVEAYANGNLQRVTNLMFSLSKITFALLFVLSLPIMVEIDYILGLWIGLEIPPYTIKFTVLTLFIMIITSMNTPLSQVVHATGKMKNYQVTTSLILCLILPVSYFFLKLGMDPTSVFWVSLSISVINQYVCLILLKKIFDYDLRLYFKKIVLPCTLILILSSIIPLLIKYSFDSSFIRIIITFVSSVVSVAFFSYLWLFEKEEQELIKKIFQKLKTNSQKCSK